MAQPTIAAHLPTACAACYGQYTDRVHVDYRAAIEGGQSDPDNPRSPHVNWVVICENCLRDGYDLLPEQANRLENLQRQLEAMTERAEQAEDYASSIEDAFSRRPSAEPTREPRTPRAKPAGKRQPRYGANA